MSAVAADGHSFTYFAIHDMKSLMDWIAVGKDGASKRGLARELSLSHSSVAPLIAAAVVERARSFTMDEINFESIELNQLNPFRIHGLSGAS